MADSDVDTISANGNKSTISRVITNPTTRNDGQEPRDPNVQQVLPSAPLMHNAPPVPVIPPLPAPDNNNAIDHERPIPSNYDRSNEGKVTTEASPNNEEASASAAANNTAPNAPSRRIHANSSSEF